MTWQLRLYARRQPGCKALMGHYGIGELTAVTILAELGDTRRFSSSRQAVRYAGLDITVHQSDQRRAPGYLSRQGPPALRWALFEAAQAARRPGSPDRAYYDQAAERLGGNRACLALARKLLKKSFHTLRELGDEALLPAYRVRPRKPFNHPDAPRPAPRILPPPPEGGRPPKTERPHRVLREDPITHHVADHPRSRTEIRPGTRAHRHCFSNPPHGPPARPATTTTTTATALDTRTPAQIRGGQISRGGGGSVFTRRRQSRSAARRIFARRSARGGTPVLPPTVFGAERPERRGKADVVRIDLVHH